MPTYTYQCTECGSETEEVRKMSERLPAPKCVLCKTDTMKQIITPGANFKLKGDWFKTTGKY